MGVSFIILNYRSELYLKKCISSITENFTSIDHEIIIINNDEKAISTIKGDENIHIFNQRKNLGFSKACNIGASVSSKEILFFLNPDTEILFFGLDQIIEKLSDDSNGIVSPILITENNQLQAWSFGRKITPFGIILNNLGFAEKNIFPQEKILETDWVSGAAFAIKKTLFEEIGGFDEKFFMYFEDVDLCKRVRDKNKKILVLPNLRVLHLEGKSSTNNKQKQKADYYESQDYYLLKNFGFLSYFSIKVTRKIALLANSLIQLKD
jgi:GT2 family glycosyltransferase